MIVLCLLLGTLAQICWTITCVWLGVRYGAKSRVVQDIVDMARQVGADVRAYNTAEPTGRHARRHDHAHEWPAQPRPDNTATATMQALNSKPNDNDHTDGRGFLAGVV